MPTATAFDWTGNQTSIFSTLAASNHSKTERQADDYYATDPIAVEKLLEKNISTIMCGSAPQAVCISLMC